MRHMLKGSILTLFSIFISFILLAENKNKWIVITTINYPTDPFKRLAKLDDWQIVVVADKKTPIDWNLENVIFLSVDYQNQCSYKMAKLLPWNHYSRKNIGYLYAIEHGAQIIYETDDDNFVYDGIDYLPEYADCLLYDDEKEVYNPYAYYGQPTVWPRGYPLKQIMNQDQFDQYIQNIYIPIQQGLVDKDPDVDAIFRLTRNELIYFNKKQTPVAGQVGRMSPFNSQNTVFYYQAFWGLYLPSTVSLRVADIWRGYITQRLLWDMNAYLCFLWPTAFQERNEHDFLKDFIQEIDLYLSAQKLVSFLNQWKSDLNFSDRILALTDDLIEQKFLHSDEKALVVAWIDDLKQIGYQFPQV